MTLFDYFLLLIDSYHPPDLQLANNEIALTFDDGPDPLYTPVVLDALAALNVKATFFLVGSQVEKYPELAKSIFEQGHSIGNHSWSHSLLLFQSQRRIKHEIEKTQSVIKKITGVAPTLYRAPWGLYGSWSEKIFEEQNLKPILWSQTLKDWLPSSQVQLKKRFKKGLRGRAVYLMHDGGTYAKHNSIANMSNVLGDMIQYAADHGFKVGKL